MFAEIFIRGGILLWLILVLGIMSIALFFNRLLHLHRQRVNAEDLLSGITNNLKRGNVSEALQLCTMTPGPVAKLFRVAIDRASENIQDLIHDLDTEAKAEIARMERRLSLLVLVAQMTPVLGLIGTIYGLLRMVFSIRAKAPLTQVADVADGLIPALVITGAGLVVSMIAYASFHVLVGKIDRLVVEMEQSASNMIQVIRSMRSKP